MPKFHFGTHLSAKLSLVSRLRAAEVRFRPQLHYQVKLGNEEPIQHTMSEEVIYADNQVSITTSRIVFGATTYALRNVTSVKAGFTAPNLYAEILLIILGAVMLLCGLANLFGRNGGSAFLACLGGGIIGGLGILSLRSSKGDFHVLIASSSGEVKALTSKDRAYIKKIVSSINDAIIRCR